MYTRGIMKVTVLAPGVKKPLGLTDKDCALKNKKGGGTL